LKLLIWLKMKGLEGEKIIMSEDSIEDRLSRIEQLLKKVYEKANYSPTGKE